MDKNTLSNYGWIVIAVLVLSVMIALATPFGSYIENGVRATTEGLFNTSKNAVNSAFEDLGVQMGDQEFEEGYTGSNQTVNKEYDMLDGANTTFTSATEVTFRSSANIDDLVEVRVDGNVVASENYTATSGSTIITFKESYIATLENGEHTIDIVSKDGKASTKFNVNIPKINPIFFYYDGHKYQASEGMTYGEWLESELNTYEYFATEYSGGYETIAFESDGRIIYMCYYENSQYTPVRLNEIIINGQSLFGSTKGGYDSGGN